jgi:hypothetical protein
MTLKDYVLAGGIIVSLFVGVLGLTRPEPVTEVVREVVEQAFGAAAGPEHTNKQIFLGGVQYGGIVATSSQGSQTITAGEFRQWVNASVASYAPGLLAGGTLTLPASSTIPDLVPRAGDRQTFCLRNATTTAGIFVTLAGGTGTNLTVASSSASALGSKVLRTGKVGCITLVRQPATASSFDIDALLTVYE